MGNFCPNCGNQITPGARFCRNCGFAMDSSNPGPGFSDRVNDPEILQAVKKQRGAAKVFAIFLVPLPFIGFVLYSAVTDAMEMGQAVMAGLFVSAVFLAFALWSFIHERAENSYEGVVVSQDSDDRWEEQEDRGDGPRKTPGLRVSEAR